MPRAVVVLTGSELVRGDKADANGAFLARELTRLGLAPARMLVVGDDPGELEEAVAEAMRADVAVFSGGLGPTHDDRTVETIARVAGRELVVDEELAQEIDVVARGVAKRIGRPYADFVPGVRKQASIPAGCLVLGLAGTAPAVVLEHEGRVAVALPGPPSELRGLWPRALEAPPFRRVLDRVEVPGHRVLRFFGPSESAVARVLEEVGGEGDGLEVTICAHDLEIRVDMFSAAGAGRDAPRASAGSSRSASRTTCSRPTSGRLRHSSSTAVARSGTRWRPPSPARAAWSRRVSPTWPGRAMSSSGASSRTRTT